MMFLHLIFFFYRTNAKGAPLNINKVSNSLINFGRKLISPAMTAPGSTGGPVPAGGSGSSSTAVVPARTLAEVPRHHLQQQQQQQQQRLMKSESMPVQLNKGKEKIPINLKTGFPHLPMRNQPLRNRN